MTLHPDSAQGLDLNEVDFELIRKIDKEDKSIKIPEATPPSTSNLHMGFADPNSGIQPPPNSYAASYIHSNFKHINIPPSSSISEVFLGSEAPPNTPLSASKLSGILNSRGPPRAIPGSSTLQTRLSQLPEFASQKEHNMAAQRSQLSSLLFNNAQQPSNSQSAQNGPANDSDIVFDFE
ncbi:hypothetical protein BB560_000984 [Smittium megazygosporum]|uniref:Uncharacterized protein n=1 Tax=Smittium megazygosporum TaxID=133381 RepID=A0A2T9ZAA3_9FUNG|nr:hypothetical protein BB560_004078 [Smittium megazygosporum]PVV04524.1 hypothetical protein BB560_000984 [Smittium megazygosporum]